MKLLLAASLASALAAQTPTVPLGFETREVVTESARAAAVRALTWTGDAYLIAIDRDLEWRRSGSVSRRLLKLPTGEQFAFVTMAPAQTALVGELNSGRIHELDLQTGTVRRTIAGPRNAFDAVALPGGDVLLNANPSWPSANANAGIWLGGPGRTPRELLALSGPSGPLVLAPNGDLIAAELGPIVPPPPGAARLLRFPGAALQQAIQGGTLTVAGASASATGFSGIYDLAYDDLDRLHVTDPGSGMVRHTAPGGLAPSGITIDVGAGRFALWLDFAPYAGAPFRGYQPGDRAPALLISHSDFTQSFATSRLMPRRPTLTAAPVSVLPPGSASLSITGAPPIGLATLFATAAPDVPEFVAATLEGVPLWLGILPNHSIPLQLLTLDSQGAATTTFDNPGGFTLDVTIQAVALGGPGTAAFGSSPSLTLHLLP